MSIPVFRPSIKRKDMDSVLSCLVSDQLWPGQQNEELITALIDLLKVDGGAAFRDPVTAYKIVLQSLQLPPGSMVGLSVLAPVYVHIAITEVGYKPVPIDVEENSGLISFDKTKEVHDRLQLSAIIIHTTLGYLPDIQNLDWLTIPIIEDITQGIGGYYDEELPAGGVGQFVMIGMEPEDLVTVGGGMVILSKTKKDTKNLAQGVKYLSATSYLTDMNAALGKTQLKELKHFIEKRRELHETYIRSSMRGHHSTLHQPGDSKSVPFGFPVVLKGGMNEPASYARKKGVETQPAFLNSVYQHLAEHNTTTDDEENSLPRTYPAASKLQLSTLLFPLYPALAGKELEIIQKVLVTLP